MSETRKPRGEEALIEGYLAPLATLEGSYGLTDDCASLSLPQGCDAVLTTDAIAQGVHFMGNERPQDLAWKALAVNVSDLVAKGAQPYGYLMALAFPEPPEASWMQSFAEGLKAAQGHFGMGLLGGDTDRRPGPLAVSITAVGLVPHGSFVRRSSARPGDAVYVSGSIGDAYLGLQLRRDPDMAVKWALDPAPREAMERRYLRPDPPVRLAKALRDHASAAMDVSDGLVKDFERMCRTSGVSAAIDISQVPLSPPARMVLRSGSATIEDLITGGEDYEVLCTVAADRAAGFESAAAAVGVAVARIGQIRAGTSAVSWLDGAGQPLKFRKSGWDHL